jgi:hypothetical protein
VFDSNVRFEDENLDDAEENLPLTEKLLKSPDQKLGTPVSALSGAKKKLYFHHKGAGAKKDLKMVVKGGLTLLEEAATSTGSIDTPPPNCSHV